MLRLSSEEMEPRRISATLCRSMTSRSPCIARRGSSAGGPIDRSVPLRARRRKWAICIWGGASRLEGGDRGRPPAARRGLVAARPEACLARPAGASHRSRSRPEDLHGSTNLSLRRRGVGHCLRRDVGLRRDRAARARRAGSAHRDAPAASAARTRNAPSRGRAAACATATFGDAAARDSAAAAAASGDGAAAPTATFGDGAAPTATSGHGTASGVWSAPVRSAECTACAGECVVCARVGRAAGGLGDGSGGWR